MVGCLLHSFKLAFGYPYFVDYSLFGPLWPASFSPLFPQVETVSVLCPFLLFIIIKYTSTAAAHSNPEVVSRNRL